MTHNLETADTIVKLILAVVTIVFYFADLISGPFAKALLGLAVIAIAIFIVRLILVRIFLD